MSTWRSGRFVALRLPVLVGAFLFLLVARPEGQLSTPPAAAAPSARQSFTRGEGRVSFWKSKKSANMMRLEESPDGELRFWAHALDTGDETTRKMLARYGLEIDAKQMTTELVLRFCRFGYENGLKYVEARRSPQNDWFEAVVAVGFDFFRGVPEPKYGNTRWKVTLRRIDDSTLHINGKLIGWRGMLTFGQISAESDLVRVSNPPAECTPSPVYALPRANQVSAR